MRLLKNLRKRLYRAEFDVRERRADQEAIRQNKHLSPSAEYEGAAPSSQKPKRLAIVAVYPSETITFSIENLLDSLLKANFWVLVVSTKTIDVAQRERILAKSHHFIERFPVGRDFGSYLMGWRWLKAKNLLADADLLALANDSLFYPASFGRQIDELLSEDRQWYGLFENFEQHRHVQSFFEVFRRDVFLSGAFERFWNSYIPFSSRKHCINEGEVKLTISLAAAGFTPRILYSGLRISKDVANAMKSGECTPNMIMALKNTLGDEFYNVLGRNRILKTLDWARKDFNTIIANDFVHALAYHLETRNPSHRVGLLCNVLYEAPLKRDMVFREVVELGVLTHLATGFKPEEISLIADDLRRKGLPSSLHSARERALYERGRI